MDNKYSLIETSDCVVCASHSHDRSKSLRKNVWCPWNQLRQISIQLMPALKVNIIIVHPRGVVFPRALAWWKTTSQGWTIIMFTWSAGINCFIILKFYFFFFASLLFRLINANISVNEQPEWFHWAHRRWLFYTYLRHVHVLNHGHFTDIVSTLAI